jgi:hypothetical protein
LSETVTREPASPKAKPSADKVVWVNKNLVVAFPGMPPPAPPRPTSKPITYIGMQKSRLAWDALRKSVQSQLQGLEAAIVRAVIEHNKDNSAKDEFTPADVQRGTKKLYEILARLDERLIETLDKALNAQGMERANLLKQAKTLIQEYQAFVQSDPMIATIDKNSFTPTTIRPAVTHALSVLSEYL